MRAGALKLLMIPILCAAMTVPVCAQERSYIFDIDGKAVASPPIYAVEHVYYGADFGVGDLETPTDIFIDSGDNLYILDAGNQRVVILDPSYRLQKELREFRYEGQTFTLSKTAKGIFYQELQKRLYIADTGNNRILMSDIDGNVERVYLEPPSELLNKKLPFAPSKVVADNLGTLFVLSEKVNTGAIILLQDGSFGGLFGANTIKHTAEVLQEYLYRRIFSFSTLNASESYQPTEFNNLFWSRDKCVYAVSTQSSTSNTEVLKLNPVGQNLLLSTTFGDPTTKKGQNFVDITTDADGLFTALDKSTGKLYQYDAACNLLGVFGGLGYTNDTFLMPVAVCNNSKKELFVLDADKRCISVFKQTGYGRMIQEALALYNEGRYIESIGPWRNILRANANFLQAHIGLGKAYMQMKDYRTAMAYFRVGKDREDYATAKGFLIDGWIKTHFYGIVSVLTVVFLAIYYYNLLAAGWQWLRKRQAGRAKG